MPKKKKVLPTRRKTSVRVKSQSARRARIQPAGHLLGHYVLPLAIVVLLVSAIIFMAFSGYQTAAKSGFFALRDIEVDGVERTVAEDIRRVVSAEVENTGVWNADLGGVREKLEKFPFVKTAAVSRVLPAGIKVNVIERVPAAAVQLSSGTYLVDSDGKLLVTLKSEEKNFPFVLKGWDESKTESAITDNMVRLKVYRKMLDEWKQFDLAARVKEVNLSNPRLPVAVVEDSGRPVDISLSRDNLGKSLKTAVEALTGKGNRVKSIDAAGVYPVIQYLDL